jgi:hypothetical protein
MPVITDLWSTFQWLRELRRGHDERLVAVYFRVSDRELVRVGRYNEAHGLREATAAAAWVLKNPAGAEVVMTRSVPAKDILSVRQVPQLIGWTEVPEASKKFACVCPACLPHGDRNLMRRVQAAFAAALLDARKGRTDAEVCSALGRLALPLERARGRLEPGKLLGYRRFQSSDIRRTTAGLLGYFPYRKVSSELAGLVADEDVAVRNAAIEALLRNAGAKRAASMVAPVSDDAIAYLIELLEFERGEEAVIDILENFAGHPAERVSANTRGVAAALLADGEVTARSKRRLSDIVSAPAEHMNR